MMVAMLCLFMNSVVNITGLDESNEAERIILSDKPCPHLIQSLYASLILAADEESLAKLIAGTSTSVSMASAWERLRRASNWNPHVPSGNVFDNDALARFLGVVEGRLKVTIPTWWEQVFGAMALNNRAIPYFPFMSPERQAVERVEPTYRRTAGHLLISIGMRLEHERELDEWAIISDDGDRLVIPREWQEQLGRGDAVTVLFHDERCYLSMHVSRDPYTLLSIDRRTGATLWVARVWAGCGVSGSTGSGWHWSSFVLTGDEVVVLGISTDAAYIESFDVVTGKAIARFWTGFHEVVHP
jgi:hypothetical protein